MTDSEQPAASSVDERKSLKRIKTGATERRASMAKAGIVAGTGMAGHSIASLFYSKETRQQKRNERMGKQARYLVEQLGQLKGSIVKVGQMMALYGEHFLPPEVTEALHGLEDQTVGLHWDAMELVLREQLGDRYSEFEFDQDPIGAASLGQVHKARRISDGKLLAFKIQYPGVQSAIDSDLKAMTGMMRMAKILPKGPDFDEWMDEIRGMLHREVDYRIELETTQRFRDRLADDPRFIVPELFPEYSSDTLMVSSFEPGVVVGSPACMALSQARRNRLAEAALELFFKEFFVWGELQTDPNFGNYRLRIDEQGELDKIILLDFGATREYPAAFLKNFHDVVAGAYLRDAERLIRGGKALEFMRPEHPDSLLQSFVDVGYMVIEPFAQDQIKPAPDYAVTATGEYRWGRSKLPERVAKSAGSAALSRHFSVPPREFIFLVRKLVGVYTFLAVLDAELNAHQLLEQYLPADSAAA